MLDPLTYLWPVVEAVTPVVPASGMRRWPKDLRERLLKAGLLKSAGTAKRVRCPACDRNHTEKVVVREAADGQVRFYVPCPEVMRAEVRPDELELFAVDVELLATNIASLLSLSGTCKALALDRVWRCGRWSDQGVLRDVLFVRGLRRNDAAQFRRAITSAHRPVVFVGSEIPAPDFWQGQVPPLIRLSEVARLDAAQLQIDVVQVVGLIRHADEAVGDTRLTLEQFKLVVRQQVKAEKKSALKDDLLVSAYKHCGSYRKAAEMLSSESGQTVTKDQVFNAVKRAGGTKAVVSGDDSESVVRTVSSRSRDTPIENRDSRK